MKRGAGFTLTIFDHPIRYIGSQKWHLREVTMKNIKIWLITGISGTNRKELFDEIKKEMEKRNPSKKVYNYDIGYYMDKEAKRLGFQISPINILNVDGNLLESIRSLALKEVMSDIKKHENEDAICFVGIHALFRWKNRLIPGVSYYDLGDPDFELTGVVNVIDNLSSIIERNRNNPVRANAGLLSAVETQEWMSEEELLSKTIADIKKCPFYILANNHRIGNIIDFFGGEKKRIYLSYPITAIRNDNPQNLETFQNKTVPLLEKNFVVYNPLAITDLGEIQKFKDESDFDKIKDFISARTVQRDFRFIDQSNAIVVYYDTDKNSPGVFAEIYYAYRTGKPVYIYYPHKTSPFLEDAVTKIDSKMEDFLETLKSYAILEN